jgi:gamma-glutamylcyclotransferase (GGCT)/AIG2-like uncharacterized protein YtfP
MQAETMERPMIASTDDRTTPTETFKVFVYGTLKSGYGNNRLLRNATFLGDGYLRDHKCYYYGPIGSFPFVVPSKGTSVLGEVYQVDRNTLSSLDSLEGYREGQEKQYFYDRQSATIEYVGGGVSHDTLYYLGDDKWRSDMVEVPCTDGVYCWQRMN